MNEELAKAVWDAADRLSEATLLKEAGLVRRSVMDDAVALVVLRQALARTQCLSLRMERARDAMEKALGMISVDRPTDSEAKPRPRP